MWHLKPSERIEEQPQEQPEFLSQYQVAEGAPTPEWIINEAHLLNEAVDAGLINQRQAESIVDPTEVLDVMRGLVSVTYFVEYPPDRVPLEERGKRLLDLFWQPMLDEDSRPTTLVDHLAKHRQSVSLAMITLDDKTAEVLQLLNDRQVPVIGWIVLPDEAGYWSNRTNMSETVARAFEVVEWAERNDVKLAGIGFDIEKSLPFIAALANSDLPGLAREQRAYKRAAKPRDETEALLRTTAKLLQARGYETEVYAMPHPVKRLSGGMDMRDVDRYVEMQYTSDLPEIVRKNARALRFMHRTSPSAIPALGIVSGTDEGPGRKLTPGPGGHHLTQDELNEHMRCLVDKRVDFAERELGLRALYLFALNDASVVTMLEQSLHTAFATVEVS